MTAGGERRGGEEGGGEDSIANTARVSADGDAAASGNNVATETTT